MRAMAIVPQHVQPAALNPAMSTDGSDVLRSGCWLLNFVETEFAMVDVTARPIDVPSCASGTVSFGSDETGEERTRVATLKMLPASACECAGKLEHTCMLATVYAMSRIGRKIITRNAMAQ